MKDDFSYDIVKNGIADASEAPRGDDKQSNFVVELDDIHVL
jgi:hypothetical protein